MISSSISAKKNMYQDYVDFTPYSTQAGAVPPKIIKELTLSW